MDSREAVHMKPERRRGQRSADSLTPTAIGSIISHLVVHFI